MENRLLVDIQVDANFYVLPLDLETTKQFQMLLAALLSNQISEFELYSDKTMFHNQLCILFKKPVGTLSHAIVGNYPTIVQGILTYVINEDTITYWIEKIFEPYILSNGRASIFDDNWDFIAYEPVKYDPSGNTFKPKACRIVFHLENYVKPPTKPKRQ